MRMRRKYFVIGVALISLSAAAAVAILPPNAADLRGNLSSLPGELWSILSDRDRPSGNPGGPHHPPSLPQRGLYSALDLPLDTAKIYVADFNDDGAVGEGPPILPPEGQPFAATGGTSQPKDTQTGNVDDGGDAPGFGGFGSTGSGATGGGPMRVAAITSPSNGEPSQGGTNGSNGSAGESGGTGAGGTSPDGSNPDEPGGGKKTAEAPSSFDNPQTDTRASVTDPMVVDEPAPLSLLLVGGLALLMARRARRQTKR